MNKQGLIFAVLFSLSALQASGDTVSQTPIKRNGKRANPSLVKLWSTYITSLVLSGAIGATTGGLTRYFEKKFNIEASPIGLVLGILGWTLESEIRNDIIAVLQNDLDVYDVGHKKSLMFKCAWIASWLTYLHV